MRLPINPELAKKNLPPFRISPSNSIHPKKRTSDNLDLGNTVGVTQDHTNLRGSSTLSGELADLLDDLVGGGLEPCGGSARVGDGGGRDTLAVAVKTTHLESWCGLAKLRCWGRGGRVSRTLSLEAVAIVGFRARLAHGLEVWERGRALCGPCNFFA